MIKETFLACALALPLAATRRPRYVYDLFRLLVSFEYEVYHDRKPFQPGQVLIYNPYPAAVAESLRGWGFKAWELSPDYPASQYGIQGLITKSPIRHEVMQIVWSIEPVDTSAMLDGLRSALKLGGYLIVSLEKPWMHRHLITNGYQILNFKWIGYDIYRKGAPHEGRYPPGMRHVFNIEDFRISKKQVNKALKIMYSQSA